VIFVLPGNGMDNMRDSLLSIAVISNRITTLFQLFVGYGYYESVKQIRSDQDNPLLLQFFDRFRYRILILGARFWYQNHHPKILIQINNNLKRAFLTLEVVD
jgi:hypothetical protein